MAAMAQKRECGGIYEAAIMKTTTFPWTAERSACPGRVHHATSIHALSCARSTAATALALALLAYRIELPGGPC